MGRYYSGDIQGKFWFGVQSSDDSEFFGGANKFVYDLDEESEEDEESDPHSTEYTFTKEADSETLKIGLDTCLTKLGPFKKVFDDFFEKNDTYNDDMILRFSAGEGYPLNQKTLHVGLEWYARYILGNKIHQHLANNEQCIFEAEL